MSLVKYLLTHVRYILEYQNTKELPSEESWETLLHGEI